MDKYTNARKISGQLCEVAAELNAMQAEQDRMFIATGQVDHSTAPRFNALVAQRRELSAAWTAEVD